MFYSVKSNVLLYERNTFDKSMYWSEGIKDNSPKHHERFGELLSFGDMLLLSR